MLALLCCSAAAVNGAELISLSTLTENILVLEFKEGEARRERRGSGIDGKVTKRPLDLGVAMDSASYALADAEGKQVHPLKVHRKSKGTDYARVGAWEIDYVLTHQIYLIFERPLVPQQAYTLRGEGLFEPKQISFGPLRNRSEAVQVNQVGFYPQAESKHAYVSHWLGDGGGLPLKSYFGRTF